MKSMHWAGVALVNGMVLLGGCHKQAPPPQGPVYPPPIAVNPDTRKDLQRLAPDALIGTVVAVIPESRLAAVADIPIGQIKVGDAITFMGGEQQPVDVGEVIAIVKDHLHVRYAEPASGGRPPAAGDLAVRFKK